MAGGRRDVGAPQRGVGLRHVEALDVASVRFCKAFLVVKRTQVNKCIRQSEDELCTRTLNCGGRGRMIDRIFLPFFFFFSFFVRVHFHPPPSDSHPLSSSSTSSSSFESASAQSPHPRPSGLPPFKPLLSSSFPPTGFSPSFPFGPPLLNQFLSNHDL